MDQYSDVVMCTMMMRPRYGMFEIFLHRDSCDDIQSINIVAVLMVLAVVIAAVFIIKTQKTRLLRIGASSVELIIAISTMVLGAFGAQQPIPKDKSVKKKKK